MDASALRTEQSAPGTPKSDLLSIVVPLWNEEENIPRLLQRLQQVAAGLDMRVEYIFANDGSRDRTAESVREHAAVLPRWRLVNLSRNFGQQAAYRAGLDVATGDAVVFLDADLQDPPEMIPEMIIKWRAGAGLVIGRRRSRAETGVRRILFDLFHSVFFYLTSGAMPRDSGTFALMDRKVAAALRALPEVNLFLPALRCWVGFEQEVVWYDRAAREGEPKQSWKKLFSYAWEGITSFSTIPLKAISTLGILISTFGFVYAGLLISIKLLQAFGILSDWNVPGFTTVAVAVFCLGGIQLLCLGIIGEYLAKVYREVKRRPIYIVKGSEGSQDAHES